MKEGYQISLVASCKDLPDGQVDKQQVDPSGRIIILLPLRTNVKYARSNKSMLSINL